MGTAVKIIINPPLLRCTKANDQRRKKAPIMDARIPVIRKLGRMVMAGSQLCHTASGRQGGPIELIIRPSGRRLPWRIS
jgi:hypothetical protein